MKSRFRKLAVESLEDRSVLSATAFADFYNDGLVDMAAITSVTELHTEHLSLCLRCELSPSRFGSDFVVSLRVIPKAASS